MNTELLEKIKKLLSLAQSDNEHEAKLASSKALELLTKHNLSMQEVEFVGLDYSEEVLDEGKRVSPESKFIDSILNKHFNVFTLQVKRKGSYTLKILGDKTNTEIARYMYLFLNDTFKTLFKQYRKSTGATASSRQSYYMGLYKGFCQQMEDAKNKVEFEKGLVWAGDPGLNKFFKDKYPNAGYSNSYVNTKDMAAQSAGYEHGKNIRVHKGINNRNDTGIKYLK